MESVSPQGLSRTAYRIAGQDIELAKVVPPDSLQVLRLGLLSLTPTELVLQIGKQRAAYRRLR
jgi:hypothetical protein